MTSRPHTVGLIHQVIVSLYWGELFIPPWLLVIAVSCTSLMVGGFLSKALLALLVYLEEKTVPSAVCCGNGVPLLLVYLASSPPIHDFVLLFCCLYYYSYCCCCYYYYSYFMYFFLFFWRTFAQKNTKHFVRSWVASSWKQEMPVPC